MASPASRDDQPSPTSLPGRDPVADADTSSSRKRMRTTPPDQDGVHEDSQEHSSGSPLIVVLDLESDTPPTADICIINDEDEILGSIAIRKFPGTAADRNLEQAATFLADAFTNPKTDLTGSASKTWIESFAQWFQDFVVTDEVAPDYTSYVQDRLFWYQIGRCFNSLAERRSELPRNHSLSVKLNDEDLFCSFAKLFAKLCAIEAEQLERATSRRDSAKPSSPGRCKLLFQNHAEAFGKLLAQRQTVSSSSLEASKPCAVATCFIDCQQSTNAFFRTLSLLATKVDDVEHSLSALSCYLHLSHSLLSAVMPNKQLPTDQSEISEGDMELKLAYAFRATTANVLKLALDQVVPAVAKIHPDAAPVGYHAKFIDDLAYLASLLETSQLPERLRGTMNVVTEFTATSEDFLVPRPDADFQNEIAPKYTALVIFKLDLAMSLVRSKIMALRVTGLEHLNDHLLGLWNSCARMPGPRCSQPLLQVASQYLLAHDVIAYLFGPESHADLIRRSGRVIEYMLVTKSATRAHIDMLMEMLLLNQNSDIGQATFCALHSMTKCADYGQGMYLCKKYETIRASQLGRAVSQLFMDIVSSMMRIALTETAAEIFEVARNCVQIIQKVSHADDHPELQPLRRHVSHIMANLFSTPHGLAERHRILHLCAEEVRNQTQSATGSVYLLLDLSVGDRSSLIADMLCFKDVVAEFLHYVKAHLGSLEYSESCKWGFHGRVLLALRTWTQPDDVDGTKIEHEFWDHAFGSKAMNNQVRGIAWSCLDITLHSAPVERGPVFRKFTSDYLPDLASAHAPAELHGISLTSYKLAFQDNNFDFPMRKQMVRFAITGPEESIAEEFMRSITTILFSSFALKFPAAAREQQAEVTTDCFQYMRSQNVQHMEKKRVVMLLRLLLISSIEFEKSCGATEAGHIEIKRNLPPLPVPATAASTVCPVVIHGPEGAQHDTVAVNEQDTFSELKSSLAEVAKCDDFTVICAGKCLELDSQPAMKVNESNVFGQTLTIRKTVTLGGIEEVRSKRAGRTGIEQAILQNLDDLYAQLDSSGVLGEKTFDLLVTLQHTTSWRPVAFCESRWKVLFSIHTLLLDLREQISRGIADPEYIKTGVLTLVDALQHFNTSADYGLLGHIALTLFEYLMERPNVDYAEQYFKDPSQFVDSALSVLSNSASIVRSSDDAKEIQRASQTAQFIYRSLLQAARLSSAVCDALIDAPLSKSVHNEILFSAKLAGDMITCILAFCMDEDTPSRMKELFWTITLDGMLQSTDKTSSCFSVFKLAPRVLVANPHIWSNELALRKLVARLSEDLLQAKHEEELGTDLVDERVPGLCTIIHFCVDKLKSFRETHQFGELAVAIYRKLLFPEKHSMIVNSGRSFEPIVTTDTRSKLYSLVVALCEDLHTVETLASITLGELDLAAIPRWFNFPGADKFNRAKCGYAGLANLQQTCYMNSLIQQLFMNVKFRKFILETSNEEHDRQQVLIEFQHTFASMQECHGLDYIPEGLARALDVDVSVQDDAQIFFTILIGKLEESMPDDGARKRLQSFFAGVNKSQTVGECGHVSESPDTYFNLSLVVKDKSCLRESLQEYVQGASLNGGDKFKCTTCKSTEGGVYVNASRRTGLESIPDNLVLGLKRFQYETYDGGAKVNDVFDFPETIDMAPYKMQHLSDPSKSLEPDVFKLVGVVVHDGTLQYGHYWSYAAERSLSDDEEAMPWFRLEDRMVKRVDIGEVLSQTRGGLTQPEGNLQPWLRSDNAYVLFYERLSSIKAATTEQKCSHTAKPGSRPSVTIPAALEMEIAAQNELHVRRLHLFADEHAAFVHSLLLRAGDIMEAAQAGAPSSVQLSLIGLAFEHVFQTTIRIPTLPEFEGLVGVLQKLTHLHWKNAEDLLSRLFSDVDNYGRFMFHKKPLVRNLIGQLASGCLKVLQSGTGNEPSGHAEVYREWLERALKMHMILLKHLHGTDARNSWPEYFAFVTDVANLGPFEHSLVLTEEFLFNALEMLYLSCNGDGRDKYPDLWFNLQNNRIYPWHALVGCIHGLLEDKVDLTMLQDASDEGLLCQYEINAITRTNRSGRNMLVLYALYIWDGDYEHCGPLKLVALLTDSDRTHPDITRSAVAQLQARLLNNDHFKKNIIAIAYCFEHGNLSEEHQRSLIGAMCQLAAQVEDAHDMFLVFMRQNYTKHTSWILRGMPEWADRSLSCDDSETEEATNVWLTDMLFSHPPLVPPFKDETIMLDCERVTAVKALAAKLMHTLQGNYDDHVNHEEMERADEAFRNCYTWLDQFVRAVETHFRIGDDDAVVSDRVLVELNEEAREVKELITQCDDVFKWLGDWADGTYVGMRYEYSSIPVSNTNRRGSASDAYNESPIRKYNAIYDEEYTDDESEEDGLNDSDMEDVENSP